MVMVLPNIGNLDRAFASVRALLTPGGKLQALVTRYSPSPRTWERARALIDLDQYAVLLDHPRGSLADVIRHPRVYFTASARHGFTLHQQLSTGPYEILCLRPPPRLDAPPVTSNRAPAAEPGRRRL